MDRAVASDTRVEMVRDDSGALLRSRLRQGPATKAGLDAGGDPRTSYRASPNHHAIRARSLQRGDRRFTVDDVAIHDDWQVYLGLDLTNRRPVGDTSVELASCACMDRNSASTSSLRARGDFGRVPARLIPAEAHLHGDRDIHGVDRRGHQGLG